jgi:hypothetical protein
VVHLDLVGQAYREVGKVGDRELHGIHGVSSSLESFFPISYHVLKIFARGKAKKGTKSRVEVCRVS